MPTLSPALYRAFASERRYCRARLCPPRCRHVQTRFYNAPPSPRPSVPPAAEKQAPQPEPPKQPLVRRIAHAWRTTPTKWYPLPITVGALLLCALAWKKSRDKEGAFGKEVIVEGEDGDVLRLRGPWQVHVLGALPLRNLSRLWGYLNGLELPVWFRPTGFKVYAWIFGSNLEEMDPPDLKAYKSLGEFFYRKLKDGARPIAAAPLVSPADGTVVHLGIIEGRRVEQVKGITYSLDSLLGRGQASSVLSPNLTAAVDDQEFANVNGIQYSLDKLMGAPADPSGAQEPKRDATVASENSVAQTGSVAQSMGAASIINPVSSDGLKEGHKLFYAVIYLAPGDYHRFHSPASWVVEKRRHFSGELFSVNPYMTKRLMNLFVLNERVALLGKWRYGFFGFVPVGATNVGSIKINFDADLRTNEAKRRPPAGTFTEASYASASRLLGGQPLKAGQEMGGFALGSTIVTVFEAPENWKWKVVEGQYVKVGEALGAIPE